jgi:hypothetical protein
MPPFQKKKRTDAPQKLHCPTSTDSEKTSSCSQLASSGRSMAFCGRKRASAMAEKQRFRKLGRSCTALRSAPEEPV